MAMPSSQSQLLILSAALGVASHVLYFRSGEHHRKGLLYFQLIVAAALTLTTSTALSTGVSWLVAVKVAFELESVFLLSLSLSSTFYRLSPFHRLASFPGPLAWRWTKLAQAFANRNLKGFEELDKLHRKYGDYVRIGPAELSVIDPDAVEVILGASSKCTRPGWYEINPLKSILTVRDEHEHRAIRRAYEHGMREQILNDYESRITDCASVFARLAKERGSEPMDVTYWFKLLVLDINNRVSFSKDSKSLETGKKPQGLNYLEDGTAFLGLIGAIPWFFILLLDLPPIRAEFNNGAEFCRNLVAERLENPDAGPDIISSIISARTQPGSVQEVSTAVTGESNVLLVAGNDTITTTLVFCCYELARQPHHAALIRRELDELRQEHGSLDARTLRMHAKHLNGVINETLRVHPGNPSGAFRTTPPGGLFVKEKYIPENVTVGIPQWSLMRSPKCFVRPNEFVPERWTTEPELVLRQDAYIPFYTGTYACAGKQLALMELRLVIAHLVREFNISFAPQETGEKLIKESKDHFNMSLEPFHLEFTELH